MSGPHRCSVLIVEDEAELQEVLRVALEADGYAVTTAANGRDALKHLRSSVSMVQAFYGSNVSVYLTRQQARAYCGYLRTLPAAPDASFIDSDSVRTFASKLKDCEGRR